MSNENKSRIAFYNRENKRRKMRLWIISILSFAAITATVVALTHPAVTLSTVCGLEAHVHGDECYEERTVPGKRSIVCGFEDFDCVVIHTHDENCYDADGDLICPLEEIEAHRHTDECYSVEYELVCGFEEGEEGHVHGPECYEEHRILVCGKEELIPEAVLDRIDVGDSAGGRSVVAHQHNENCIHEEEPSVERVLTCTIPEHVHTDECFAATREDGSEKKSAGEDRESPGDTADRIFEYECFADEEESVLVTMRGRSDVLPFPADEITMKVKALSFEASFGCIEELLNSRGENLNSFVCFDVGLYHGDEPVLVSDAVEISVSGAYDAYGDGKTGDRIYVFGIDTRNGYIREYETVKDEKGALTIETPLVSRFELAAAGKKTEKAALRGVGDHGTIETVDSREDGITLNLFDYYGANLDTWDNKVTTPIYNGINYGRNVNNHLLFLGSGSGASTNGINHYTNGHRALQGIVNRTLTNGYPTLRTNNSSLSYLFDLTPNGNTKRVYADVNHLFTKDENGYYRYDSDQNYAYYSSNTGGGDFTVYNDTYNNSDGTPIGFFPFNDYDTRYRNVKPDQPSHYNHHFGMTMTASFYMPPDGKVNGEDMIFEFSGDDDIWVFIDDVLVLDMGGLHDTVRGQINFATGEVTVSGATPASCAGGTAIGTRNTIEAIFAAAGRTYDGSDYSEHTISFFYLERGGCYSNCSLSFNLSVFQKRALEIEKEIDGEDSGELMDTEFRFRLYVGNGSDPDDFVIYTGPAYYSDGSPVAFTDEGVFVLRAGEKIVAPDIPDYKHYYIEELDVDSTVFREVRINGEVCQPVYSSQNDALYTIYSSQTSIKDRMEIICENVLPRPPKISVEKLWEDIHGSPAEPSAESVSIELWRKYLVPEGGQSHTIDFRVLVYDQSTQQAVPYHIESVEVADGGSVSFASALWQSSIVAGASSTGGPVTQNGTYNFESWLSAPVYVRESVEQDETVTILYYIYDQSGWIYQNQVNDLRFTVVDHDEPLPPDPSAGTYVSELVETVVLNDENGWSYRWEDGSLPSEYAPGVPYYYYVSETEVEGYLTSYTNNDGITAGVITVTNTAQTVGLTVTKLVAGTPCGDAFPFTIVFEDAEGNVLTGILPGEGYEVDENGTVSFVLHDGESVTVEGLPLGTTAFITETEHDGFTVLIKEGDQTLFAADNGSVLLNDGREITFVNSAGAVLPATGGRGSEFYIFGGAAVMLIAVMCGTGWRIWKRRTAAS